MKKIITQLPLLILVLACVFASQSHKRNPIIATGEGYCGSAINIPGHS